MKNKNDGSIWQSRPVFITSTFRDMHAERDHLRNVVFPELAERLRERRHHLEPIDLRWGVETVGEEDEQAKQLLVLKVCLNEVERSRPFLIGLLGDRYGWIPPEERMRAAAREAGFEKEVAGRSVTDLEIDFGVLSSTEQRRRCFFYFRESLPYAKMRPETAALYSDAHSTDPDGPAAVDKLAALKSRIESALPDRVRHYQADWDSKKERITDLDAWGRQVLEDIWSELDIETADFAGDAEPSWQAVERFTLEQFLEERGRGFVGREDILKDLTTLALSPAEEDKAWGRCVVGAPGAGKSALFAALHSRLQDQDVLLLSHAAGISARSGQVDALLRCWIEESADFLQIADPIADDASAEDVDETFRSLLSRASTQRRVVVLIDALNQFEPTTRAEHLTWLPKLWPANARLIVTAITGSASEAFAVRPGVTASELSPLSEAEAGEIVTSICKRYHRELNPEVLTTLLAKKRTDNDPACGNPLWLEIAVEELNLLDADAFEHAEQHFTGTPEEQLLQLLMATVDEMPGEVKSLYAWMLKRAEKLHGDAWTRAFTDAIGVSRSGWRESDLQVLMPVLSGEEWDDLKFAALRRSFRAHLIQRGGYGQWDFAHQQMRAAIEGSRLTGRNEVMKLHKKIADHLLSLPANDSLHQTETMVHLIESDDRKRAAQYYAGNLMDGEPFGATQALGENILATESERDAGSGMAWTISLLQTCVQDNDLTAALIRRFLFDLDDALSNVARLQTRLPLMHASNESLENLVDLVPGNAQWHRDLAASHHKLGNVLTAQGDGKGAEQAHRAGLVISETLARDEPGNGQRQHGLSTSQNILGGTLAALGDSKAAESAFRAGHRIAASLARSNPDNAQYQLNLMISNNGLGNVLATQGKSKGAEQAYRDGLVIGEALACGDPDNVNWQRNISVSHSLLGETLLTQGDSKGAEQAYRAGMAIRRNLVRNDPGNARWQYDLSASYNSLGDVLTNLGDGKGAEQVYRAGLAICEILVHSDPGNALWQRDLSISQEHLGDALAAKGDSKSAEQAYRTSHAIFVTLAHNDPENARRQRDLLGSHNKLAYILSAQGDGKGARQACRAALAIAETLARDDPENTRWQRDLSMSYEKLGEMLTTHGDGKGAERAYRASHEINTTLARNDPDNAQWQRYLALSHNKLSDVLTAQGDDVGAEQACLAGLTIAETLAHSDPDNALWQRDLSLIYDHLGRILVAQGNDTLALQTFQISHAIIETLARSDPGNAGWQDDLCVSHNILGDFLSVHGDSKGAAQSYRASHAVREILARSDPDNAERQRDLSMGHSKLGDILLTEGDNKGAEQAYRASLAVRETLAHSDPTNARWQRDLAISHDKLGAIHSAQGNDYRAEQAFRASNAIFETLARSNPSNTLSQNDLAASHDHLGDILAAEGDRRGAQYAYRASHSIREAIVRTAPGNLQWRRDLALSHIRLGDLLAAQDDGWGAERAYRASQNIFEILARDDPNSVERQRDLAMSHDILGDILLAKRDSRSATQTYSAALTIAEQLAHDNPDHIELQRDLVFSFYKLANAAEMGGDSARESSYLSRCRETLRSMQVKRMPLDPTLKNLLRQLEGTDNLTATDR